MDTRKEALAWLDIRNSERSHSIHDDFLKDIHAELASLRARLQAVEAENERMRALLVRVWRQSEVNPGSKLYEDMERFFAAQPTKDK